MHTCPICNEQFDTGPKLGGHMTGHKKGFNELIDIQARKRRILKQRGHRCECCGNSKWMGKAIPIQIDHIDGNRDNNEDENLRLLCPNCHAMTETFSGKNHGRFDTESSRLREKYRKGS